MEVVDDERGIGGRITTRLARIGVDAHVVAQVSADASGFIFAKGLLAHDSQDDAIAVQRAALEAARVLARRPPGGRVFVTLQDTGGDFGASGRAGERAWSGGLAGLVKTAAAEWPDAAVKAVDIASDASPDAVADRVVAELLLGGRDVEVALDADGRRAILRHRQASYRPIAASASRIRSGSVLLVSGGARGVTATSIAALCKHHPRLALLGRTELVDEPLEVRGAATDAELRRALLATATAAGKVVPPRELAREAKLILDCREIPREHRRSRARRGQGQLSAGRRPQRGGRESVRRRDSRRLGPHPRDHPRGRRPRRRASREPDGRAVRSRLRDKGRRSAPSALGDRVRPDRAPASSSRRSPGGSATPRRLSIRWPTGS